MRRSFYFMMLIVVFVANAHEVSGEVVFGNLGSSGTDPASSVSTDIGTGLGPDLIAQGFMTGGAADTLSVASITLGLHAMTTSSRTVSIYSSVANRPGTALFTSTATAVGVGSANAGLYEFFFSPAAAALSANSTYWIVPSTPVSWYEASGAVAPSAFNGSGYVFIGSTSMSAGGSTWGDLETVGPFSSYTLSINAVPEPANMMLSGLVFTGAFLTYWSRSRGKNPLFRIRADVSGSRPRNA